MPCLASTSGPALYAAHLCMEVVIFFSSWSCCVAYVTLAAASQLILGFGCCGWVCCEASALFCGCCRGTWPHPPSRHPPGLACWCESALMASEVISQLHTAHLWIEVVVVLSSWPCCMAYVPVTASLQLILDHVLCGWVCWQACIVDLQLVCCCLGTCICKGTWCPTHIPGTHQPLHGRWKFALKCCVLWAGVLAGFIVGLQLLQGHLAPHPPSRHPPAFAWLVGICTKMLCSGGWCAGRLLSLVCNYCRGTWPRTTFQTPTSLCMVGVNLH